MTVELESRPEVKVPSELKPRQIGKELLAEAFEYPELVEAEEIEIVGTFTSFRLHESLEGVGQWVSIHFRENLDRLQKIESEITQTKEFLRGIKEDLHLLAQELKKARLADVGIVIGLTGLSETWGRKHGFWTFLFTRNKRIIKRHNRSIANNPRALKDKLNPLNLFLFPRNGFIEEFSQTGDS